MSYENCTLHAHLKQLLKPLAGGFDDKKAFDVQNVLKGQFFMTKSNFFSIVLFGSVCSWY